MGLLSTIGAASARAFGLTRIGLIKDLYFNLVTLLLPGNGTNGAQNNTFLDSGTANGGSGFTITRNGDVTQGTFSPFSQTGWSNFFNGTTDYLAVANNAAFNFGSGDFTLEAFIFPNFSSERHILGYAEGTNTTRSFYFAANSTYTKFYWYTDGTTANTLTSATVSLNNSWNHVAVSRSGSTLYLFVNGVLSNSSAISGSLFSNVNCVFNIGREANFNAAYFPGHISNVRVIKGTALYTATFTPPAAPLTNITNTSLLTCQSNRFIDNGTANTGGTPFTVTPNGTPSIQAFSPFAPTAEYSAATVGGSGYFDGTGDFLQTQTTTSFAFGTGNFTIEGWVYLIAYNVGACLFGTTQGATTGYYVNLGGDINSLRVTSNATGTWTDNITVSAGNGIRLNEWTHIALVRNAGSLILYKNGVNVASTSSAATWNFTSPNNAGYIGRVTNGSSTQDLAGWITSLRVSNNARTITVPTSPYTNDANTLLLLNFTNAGITDATGKNVLETEGGAQISTVQSRFGGSSMYFDGTGDWLVARYNPNLELGSGDFTVEAWVYFSTLPSNAAAAIVSYGDSDNTPRWLLYYDSRSGSANGLRFTVIDGSGTAIILVEGGGTSGWAANTWYHVAVTRSGNSWRLFRDGTQTGSTLTDTDAIPAASNNGLVIGAEPNGGIPLTGYIDDLRITKGYARYTANFTAPTAAFPLQ